jgi:hypothetical protein
LAKEYRIRIRGKQRDDIDIDLLAQALLMLAEDLQAKQAEDEAAAADDLETEPEEES